MAGDETKGSKAAGGEARAASLTAQQRSAIAKKAALMRWGDGSIPRATHSGLMKVGGLEIPCFVLENGKRVISQGGMSATLGITKGGARKVAGDRIANLLAVNALKPYVPKRLTTIPNLSLPFRLPRGGAVGNGYDATILVDICETVIAARHAGEIGDRYATLFARCELLYGAFARTGIIALVDEATGYQDIRPGDALQKYLEAILRKELAAWSKRFPDEFYENIYKLKGWPWPGMSKNRYSVVAQYTRDLVYERIAPTLLQELEARSPKNEKGVRKNKLHQWLTDDVGNPLLAQHLYSLMMFQRLAIANGHGWKRFVRTVDQVMPRKGHNLELPLGDPTEPEPPSSAGLISRGVKGRIGDRSSPEDLRSGNLLPHDRHAQGKSP